MSAQEERGWKYIAIGEAVSMVVSIIVIILLSVGRLNSTPQNTLENDKSEALKSILVRDIEKLLLEREKAAIQERVQRKSTKILAMLEKMLADEEPAEVSRSNDDEQKPVAEKRPVKTHRMSDEERAEKLKEFARIREWFKQQEAFLEHGERLNARMKGLNEVLDKFKEQTKALSGEDKSEKE